MNEAHSYNVSPDVFFKKDLNSVIRRDDRDMRVE